MTSMKIVGACIVCAVLGACNATNPRAGASVSVGSGGVSVSPHVGVSLGRARVGVGL